MIVIRPIDDATIESLESVIMTLKMRSEIRRGAGQGVAVRNLAGGFVTNA